MIDPIGGLLGLIVGAAMAVGTGAGLALRAMDESNSHSRDSGRSGDPSDGSSHQGGSGGGSGGSGSAYRFDKRSGRLDRL